MVSSGKDIDDCTVPELVKTVAHIAFVVDDLEKEIEGKNVIIKPNSPSEGLMVAFVEVNGAPVELMEYFNKKNKT